MKKTIGLALIGLLLVFSMATFIAPASVNAGKPAPAPPSLNSKICKAMQGTWTAGKTTTCTIDYYYDTTYSFDVPAKTTLAITTEFDVDSTSLTVTNHGTINLVGDLFVHSGTFTNYGTISIGSDSELYNGGTFTNSGTITSSGTLYNVGTFDNSATGSITVSSAGSFETDDMFSNEGSITFNSPISYNWAGTFANTGIVNIGSGATFETKSGTTNNEVGGTINVLGGGSLTGSRVYLYTTTGLVVASGGTVTALVFVVLDSSTCNSLIGGTWTSSTCTKSTGTVSFTGDFNTFGASLFIGSGTTLALGSGATLTDSGGIYIDLFGTLTNSGTVTISNSWDQSYGIDDWGTITNSGTITVDNTCDSCSHGNKGLVVDYGGSLTNSGTIDIDGGSLSYSTDIAIYGTFTNSGTITMNIPSDSNSWGIAIEGGTFTNAISGTITTNYYVAYAIYLFTGTMTNNGTINNYGQILVTIAGTGTCTDESPYGSGCSPEE